MFYSSYEFNLLGLRSFRSKNTFNNLYGISSFFFFTTIWFSNSRLRSLFFLIVYLDILFYLIGMDVTKALIINISQMNFSDLLWRWIPEYEWKYIRNVVKNLIFKLQKNRYNCVSKNRYNYQNVRKLNFQTLAST